MIRINRRIAHRMKGKPVQIHHSKGLHQVNTMIAPLLTERLENHIDKTHISITPFAQSLHVDGIIVC
jgi:hypothetical protein